MPFSYGTMPKKYETLTGKPAYKGYFDLVSIRDKCACITVGDSWSADIGVEMLNWCEDHFGDNWIYEWNRFYFKNPEDATMFALRW